MEGEIGELQQQNQQLQAEVARVKQQLQQQPKVHITCPFTHKVHSIDHSVYNKYSPFYIIMYISLTGHPTKAPPASGPRGY